MEAKKAKKAEYPRSAVKELRKRLRADFREMDRALKRLEAISRLETLIKQATA